MANGFSSHIKATNLRRNGCTVASRVTDANVAVALWTDEHFASLTQRRES